MEILAAFDLMGSLRAAADVAGLPITPSPGWSPNATPGARDSLSGPVRRLDRRRVSRGVVTGSHLDTAVQGQSWGPPWATVRPLGWWRLRSHGPGAATGFRASSENGPWARFTRGGRGVGHSWAEETTGSGDREAIGVAAASRRIGRRYGRRRIQEYLALRHTWRSGIPDGPSGRVVWSSGVVGGDLRIHFRGSAFQYVASACSSGSAHAAIPAKPAGHS